MITISLENFGQFSGTQFVSLLYLLTLGILQKFNKFPMTNFSFKGLKRIRNMYNYASLMGFYLA